MLKSGPMEGLSVASGYTWDLSNVKVEFSMGILLMHAEVRNLTIHKCARTGAVSEGYFFSANSSTALPTKTELSVPFSDAIFCFHS